jgi:hypothetical protein
MPPYLPTVERTAEVTLRPPARHRAIAAGPLSLILVVPMVLVASFVVLGGRRPHGTAPPLEGVEPRLDELRRPWLRVTALAIVAIIFFSLYWFSFPRQFAERPVFNSPRESIGFYLTQRALDGHGYNAPLHRFDDLPRDVAIALTPRDAALSDGHVVPKDFAGTMLLHTLAMALHPAFMLAIGPVFALLGAWALYRLGVETFGVATGIVAGLAWLTFPPLWINSSLVFTGDLPALAFYLLAALLFMRYWRAPSLGLAAATSVCFFASVLFRYPNLLLAIPFVLALLAGRRTTPDHALLAGAMSVPFVTTILVFNAAVYGAPFTTGFHLGASLLSETANFSSESFFKLRPDVLPQYMRNYGAIPAISVPIAAGLGSSVVAAVSGSREHRILALVSLSAFAILLIYYGQQDAWGFNAPHLAASFLRYMLPGFALMVLYAAWALASMASRWGAHVYVVLAIFVAASAWLVYHGNGGVANTHATIHAWREAKVQVLAATGPDDIIATRIADKVLFPERQTLTLTYALQNDTPVSKGDAETWDHLPSPERLAEVAGATYAAGISLYIIHDGRLHPFSAYQAALHKRGLYFRRIVAVDAFPFYKVSRMPVEARH